jgi:small subunit ribosomal protein S9
MTAEPKKKTSGTKKPATGKPRTPRVRKVAVKPVEQPTEATVAKVSTPISVESVTESQGKYSFAVGRRKTSVARIRLYHKGTGAITVNGKDYRAYFPVRTWQDEVISPLVICGTNDTKDVSVVVLGGGPHSQAGAVRHGISRALLDFDETFRKTLKKVGYLTRDPRMKERKKPGLRRARRAPQWAKR